MTKEKNMKKPILLAARTNKPQYNRFWT